MFIFVSLSVNSSLKISPLHVIFFTLEWKHSRVNKGKTKSYISIWSMSSDKYCASVAKNLLLGNSCYATSYYATTTVRKTEAEKLISIRNFDFGVRKNSYFYQFVKLKRFA